MLGTAVTQNDAADLPDAIPGVPDGAGYVYVDSGSIRNNGSLIAALRNPVTRSSVLSYFEERIGNPEVAKALLDAADHYDVDPALVVAVSWQESRFVSTVQGVNYNRTLDRGLMQLNSATFSFLSEEEFFDPHLNARYGVSYLRESLDRSGNEVAALAMYNAGPGRVKTLGAPRTTLDYINNVLSYRDALVNGYFSIVDSESSLVSSRIKPIKNPDLL